MSINIFKKYIFYPGVFLGLTLIFLEFSALFLGLLFHENLSIIFIAMIFFSISFALRKYRKSQNGRLKLFNAFKISFGICLISGLIWSVYRFIQYSLKPSIVEQIISINKDAISETWVSSERLEFMLEVTENATTPATLAFMNTFIVSMILGGSILSLFLALILKRDTPIGNNN